MAVAILILFSCNNKSTTIKTGLEGEKIPPFKLLLSDSVSYLNTESITKGPVVFISLAPWCPYCKAQIEELISKIKSLQNIHFYILTTSPFKEFNQFTSTYQLNKYQNITTGIDNNYYFINYFKNNAVPYLAIYGKDKKLKAALVGKSSVDLIKEIAEQN